jgi:hypothetical protein
VTDTQKKAYTALHRLVWNIKKLLDKVPYSVHRQRYDNFWQALWLLKEEVNKVASDKHLVEKTVQRYLYEGKDMSITFETLKNSIEESSSQVNPIFDGRDIREDFDDSAILGKSGKLYIKGNIVEYWETPEGKAPCRRVWSFATSEDAVKVFEQMKTQSVPPLLKECDAKWSGTGVPEEDQEKLKEDEGGTPPANNVGDGHIAGCNQDPVIDPKKKKKLTESTATPENEPERIRKLIVSEYQAITEYEQFASATSNENLKKIFLDIAAEEKVHVGELEAMLYCFDPEHASATSDGKIEAVQKTSQE